MYTKITGPAEHMGQLGFIHTYYNYIPKKRGRLRPPNISLSPLDLTMFRRAWYQDTIVLHPQSGRPLCSGAVQATFSPECNELRSGSEQLSQVHELSAAAAALYDMSSIIIVVSTVKFSKRGVDRIFPKKELQTWIKSWVEMNLWCLSFWVDTTIMMLETQ